RLLRNWEIPDELAEAVEFQYKPEEAKLNPDLCCIVHLSNFLALSAGVGVDIGGMKEQLSSFALTRLKMTDHDMQTLYAGIPEMIDQMKDLHLGSS
ncbi:MAG: HDOD domain-containing protein, partial [Spirochaetia bacterium]|nr:HDOD domain-containing protein [Spirochaetia bacterium]